MCLVYQNKPFNDRSLIVCLIVCKIRTSCFICLPLTGFGGNVKQKMWNQKYRK